MEMQTAKLTAISLANDRLREAGLPTYSDLQEALAALHANCWLDADPSENEHVAVAKEGARKVCAASLLT